jgi:hypothetical protein
MAAGLGFKTFATGDILTAADANGYLMSQTVMVFASAAARTTAIASPQQGMITFLKDTNATQYYNGTTWTSIGGGGGGGGKVLQVVTATTTSQVNITSTTYTDSGLSATITPSASTSRILVLTTQPIMVQTNAATAAAGTRLVRGSTTIADFAPSRYESHAVTAAGVTVSALRNIQSISFLDSPATTSAVTYKTQGALQVTTNSSTMYFQETNALSSITLLEIGA